MAAAHEQLTVVLTLKDRTPFTYRWLRYMNDMKCPYPILIADGGEDETVESYLSRPENYPDLHYTYLRYPIDSDYETYYQKFADVIDRVTTPYVLLADNDDFLFLEHIPTFIRFLDEDRSFVSCGGEPIVLSLLSADDGVVTAPTAGRYRAMTDDRPKSIIDDHGVDRVCYFLANIDRHRLWLSWYQVHRTSALRSATNVIRDHAFADPVSLEIHVHMCLLMAGKYQQFKTPSYVRQNGTSQFTSEIRARGNLVERFAWSNAFGDFRRSLESFASPLSDADRARIHKAIAQWFSDEVIRLYSKPAAETARGPADSIARLYRLSRRLLRPIARPFRPQPVRPPALTLPRIEKYILDPV